MREIIDEFLKLQVVNPNKDDCAWGYIHQGSITAVCPSFHRGGSIIHMASGNCVQVAESPGEIMEMVRSDESI